MPEEFTIQCQSCGTFYDDVEEVCPYCGEPQPLAEADYDDELILEESVDRTVDLLAYDQISGQARQAGAEDEIWAEDHLYLEEQTVPEEDYLEDEYPVDEQFTDDYQPEQQVEGNYSATQLLEDDEGYVIPDEEVYQPSDDYDEVRQLFDDGDEEFEDEDEAEPRHFAWRRLLLGCLGMFICIITFFGGIGLLATYHGLQERAQDVQNEAEAHYQRGQVHLTNGEIELANAEFERALNLNPNLLPAREALREAQSMAQSRPTPTSETRSAAAAVLLEQAETEIEQEAWLEAVETLSKVRDLNPDYQPERVSEFLYEANYRLGLQFVTPDTMAEALTFFEKALKEVPYESAATVELARANLYLDGKIAIKEGDSGEAVDLFSQLYQESTDYLDVEQQLLRAYERFGDALAADDEWCLAEVQYVEASAINPGDNLLQTKSDKSGERCQETASARTNIAAPSREVAAPSPTDTPLAARANEAAPRQETETVVATATTLPASGAGSIFYAFFNLNEARWEILSIPSSGGSPRVVVMNGAMPAVSPNGQLLLYRSESIESEGFHIFDLTTGEDKRIEIFRQYVLPRWGGDNTQYLFVAQEPATSRWQVHLGFADGKGDAQILRDGRTPDWSPDNRLVAFQGTDAEGNNPGIYLVPFNGGETTRLTNHESDRAPDFSPDGSMLSYMSTQNGNWDIYIVSVSGGTPRQLTTNASNDGLPAWSPDGTKIAYVSDSGGSWAINVIDVSGGAPLKVTSWDGNKRPDWLMAQISWGR